MSDVTIVYTEVEAANIEVTEEEAYIIETPATQGVTGPTGPTGTAGSVWYAGEGVPSDALLGVDTDWYVNTLNGDAYNKIAGAWSLELNIKGTVDVIAAANITDNSIVRGDGGLKGVQDSNLIVDDTGNIIPTTSGLQELGSAVNPFKDLIIVDENGTAVTVRELAKLQRDYSEGAAVTPYTISSAVSGSVWTITITADGEPDIGFTLDGIVYRSAGTTLSVNATSFAGTDLNPKRVYVYVIETGGFPVLTASNTSPEGIVTHAHTAEYMAGLVSASSVKLYCKAESIIMMDEIASNVYHRTFAEGPIYLNGMGITATQTDLTIALGSYQVIFDSIATVSRTVGTDGLFYIDNDGTYHTLTDFSFTKYSNGDIISNDKYYNVILGVTQDGTTNIHALVQSSVVGKEYGKINDAIIDKNNDIRTVPRDSLLRNTFIPVARVIIKNNVDDYLQEFPNGEYFLDVRTEGVVGGGGDAGATSPLTTKGDIYVYSTLDDRLPIGTDNYVLTADAAETTGMKWSAAGAGAGTVDTSGTPVVNDYARFTGATTIEGRSYTEVKSDLAIVAADVSDFDTEVANNSAVALNTAKISNATHTGHVTGSTALTIADNVVDEANLKLPAGPTNDYVLTADSAQTGGMKWAAAAGGDSDKISEGDSSVEVIDAGTGYVSTTIDGSEVTRVKGGTLRVGDGLDQGYAGKIFMASESGSPVFGGRTFHNTATSAPRFEFGRARGTIATPSSLAEGDRIGGLNTLNYTGSYQYTGGIFFINDGTPSVGVAPTKITFETGTTNTASRTERFVVRADGCCEPGADDSQDFGSSSKRWTDIYATNATIQTSDERMKRDIVDVDLGLDFIIALTPKTFKWEDYTDEGDKDVEQYDEDGELLGTKKEHYKHEHKHHRKHHGLMAQDVEKVVKGFGKSNQDFAGIIYDEKEDRYGLRYNEFIAPMIRATQELSFKNDVLEDRIEALEKLVAKLLKSKGGK